jgi:hypothetical protein
MKKSNSYVLITVFAVMVHLFSSCTGNASFTSEEMRFVKPFGKDSVVIYKSAEGMIDTIRFLKIKIDTIKYRNFEQGFYNENTLTVGYELTKNSFHKITVQSIDSEPEHLLLFLKAKDSHSSKEISFLGLVFDENYINKIAGSKDRVIVFSSENARYTGVNINEGIKSFKFDFSKGVVSFIDKNDVEWVRIN